MTRKPNKPDSIAVEIRVVTWRDASQSLSSIRRRVFIEEQQVPEALEWDGLDDAAVHVLAVAAHGQPVGCARLLAGGRIGRMAVLPSWRGLGVGCAMLQQLILLAGAQGNVSVTLSAQVHAIPFYQRAGFQICSETYLDAGIPHRDMIFNPGN